MSLPLGCVTFDPRGSTLVPSPAVAERPAPDLPPDKAAEACLVTAQKLDEQGDEKEAIAFYEQARRDNPKLVSVARRLAVLYDRQGDVERAEAQYREALRLSPKDADLLNDVGYFCYERGKSSEAEKYLRQALAISPKYDRAWVNLGLVLGQQQRYEESYEAFAKAVTPAEAHANVGVLLVKNGKNEEAREAFRQALALQPDLKQALTILAVLDKPGATPDQGPSNVSGGRVVHSSANNAKTTE